MRFVVGMKFGPEDDGALSFAGWMRTQSEDSQFVAHHTVELQLRTLDPEVAAELEAESRRVARRALRGVGLDDVEIAIAAEGAPESNLAGAPRRDSIDAIIVGRRARTEQRRLVRLGAVARRLLRLLPAPVIVAPPDLASAGIGTGPVVLALDGDTRATRAAKFAQEIAAATGRPLVVAHVLPTVAQVAAPYVPTAYWGRVRDEWRAANRRDFEASVEALALGELRRLEAEGAVVPTLIEVARDEQASLVVCSSRQLSTAERIFNSSVGSALAADAPFAVAVVPA